MIQKLKQKESDDKAIAYSEIDWNNFLFTFKEFEMKILEFVYLPKPKTTTFFHIYEISKQLNYSQRSARRIINKLAKLHLLKVVRSIRGFINPINDLTSNIHSLINLYNSKKTRVNQVKFSEYDNLLKLLDEEKEDQEKVMGVVE